jgi:hypothetical protein
MRDKQKSCKERARNAEVGNSLVEIITVFLHNRV